MLRVLVTAAVLLAICVGPVDGEEAPSRTAETYSETSNDRCGTDLDPVVVKVVPPVMAESEARQNQQQRDDEAASRWLTVKLTGLLTLFALLQTVVFGLQARQLKRTIEATDRNAARELRAYVSVGRPLILHQDLNTGFKFELHPSIKNAGQTPAYQVFTVCKVDILPHPLPQGFVLPMDQLERQPSGTLGPGEALNLRYWLDRLVFEPELQDIKAGSTHRLYVYGAVFYRDAFVPEARTTRFCQWLEWSRDGTTALAMNTPEYNDAS